MLIRKILYLPLFIFIYGCAASYAPQNWLPETEQVQEEAYGGWLTILSDTAQKNIEGQRILCAGEFIGFDSGKVYLLADSLIIIKKNSIERCVLELDQKSMELFVGWSLLGTVSTLSHGIYLLVSALIWITTGIAVSGGESYRDRYEAEFPGDKYWDNVQKYARFPQGITPQLDLKVLKPKIVEVE